MKQTTLMRSVDLVCNLNPSLVILYVPFSNDHSEGGQSSGTDVDKETELQTHPNSLAEAMNMSGNFIKRKTAQILQVVTGSSKIDIPFPPQLAALVDAYASSKIASFLQSEVNRCFN